eukprot:s1516_g20.t1
MSVGLPQLRTQGAAEWGQALQDHCTSHEGLAAENRRLREELRDLREDFRRLTLRVDRQADQISELSASVVSSAAASQISARDLEAEASTIQEVASASDQNQLRSRVLGTAGGYSWPEREAVAREVGAFLRRCVDGENRGESGRDRLKGLQSRIYIVVRDKEDQIYNPVRLVKSFSEVRALCSHCSLSRKAGLAHTFTMNGQPDEEASNPPPLDAGIGLDSLDGAPIGPRDFVVAPEAGPVEENYHVGRLIISSSGLAAGVIAIAELDGKLLVALPEVLWNRSPARRLVPSRALAKPVLCAVAACHTEERDVPLASVYCKVWVGFASRDFERDLDFVSEEVLTYDFNPEGESDLLPADSGLVEVAREHFSFVTAESAVPECPPEPPANQEGRLQSLEPTMVQIQESLSTLLGHVQGGGRSDCTAPHPLLAPAAKPAASERRTKRSLADPVDIPGLDKEAVRAALAAGVPLKHLQEVGSVLKSRPKRLDELPRKRLPNRKTEGPLSESEEESEGYEPDLLPDAAGLQGGAGSSKQMEQAVLHLASIAKQLTAPKEKKDKIESLLDGGAGLVPSSESSSSSGSRKNSVAMRALQRLLVEDPKYIYQVLESNLQSDFQARPVQPGEPMSSGTTVRGWLAARSRVQNYTNHVRWCWQTAGIWDALIAGKHEEARARCGLLLASAEQASIDGGSWVVSNVALLEQPPPYQAFASHQAPSSLELQHSSLFDPRWAEIFLGHLKEVDSFVEAKKKLGNTKAVNRESAEDGGKKGKPKAKAKGEKDDKGKKGPSPPDGGGAAQA